MKIRKLKLENHPFFGDLEIDFTNNGKTVDNIIIAGENGCGKSRLLSLIFSHSRINLDNNQRNEKRYFEIEFTHEDIEAFSKIEQFKQSFNTTILNDILYISIDYNIIKNWGQVKISFKTTGNETKEVDGRLFAINETIKSTSMIFSDIEINYTPQQITYITAKEIDDHNGSSLRSSQNLATEIAQLFVDMVNSDAIDYSAWSQQHKKFDETKLHPRLDRFTNAFNQMFPNKKFKEVRNIEGGKDVVFIEHSNESTLSQLSSGEKQIVFRGGFLLKDVNSLRGATVLIDEPEISLHPTWQMKIMDFYKNIFTDANTGIQTSQIIAVTHSPFIIHNPNRSNDKVIILKKDSSGRIYVSDSPEYYSWTNEKLVKEAFNIDLSSTIAQNIVFVEGETDEKYFKKCLELKGVSNIEVKWIGSYINGGATNTGDKALNSAYSFIKSNHFISQHKKIIFLYDTDTNKPNSNDGNLFIRCMQKNPNNLKYKKGVENLLSLSPNFNYDDYIKEHNKTDDYGVESILKELDKTKLCDHLCNNKTSTEQQEIFVNIFSEIDKLKTIFGL